MESRIDRLLASCRAASPWHAQANGLSRQQVEEAVAALRSEGIEARLLDGARLAGKAELLDALAKAFAFPGHFGRNWDALLDCLSDLSWLPARGYVCILWQADQFKAADAASYRTFLKVCQEAAARWSERRATWFKLVTVK